MPGQAAVQSLPRPEGMPVEERGAVGAGLFWRGRMRWMGARILRAQKGLQAIHHGAPVFGYPQFEISWSPTGRTGLRGSIAFRSPYHNSLRVNLDGLAEVVDGFLAIS